MIIEIYKRYGLGVIFACEAVSIKEAVELAVSKKVSLASADLSNSDLSRANLSGADLRGANLHDTHLHEANLCVANLSGANLRGANLRNANLSEANMSNANLRNADLCYANMHDADMSNIYLRGVDLTFTCVYGFYLGNHFGYAWKKGNTVMVKISYHELTLAEWIKDFETIGKKEKYTPEEISLYGDMLQLIKKHYK